jgi:hypothetical protein
MKTLRNLAVVLVFLGCGLSSFNAAAQQSEPSLAPLALPSQFAASAIGQAGPAAGKTFGLTVYIDELSSNGEVDELFGVLKQKGQDGVVSAMDNLKDKGRIAPTGSVGTGVRVIRVHPTSDGGKKIVLVTNRPITFNELYNFTRSTQYPFAIVVLNVDKDGKGTGSFAPLCKIKFNKKKEIEIEHYGQKPFRLANVYLQK